MLLTFFHTHSLSYSESQSVRLNSCVHEGRRVNQSDDSRKSAGHAFMCQSPLQPKPRDYGSDGLDPFEWNSTPPSVEQAYRRGFVQGAAQALFAMQAGLSAEQIEKWVFKDLWKWRYAERMAYCIPPSFKDSIVDVDHQP